MAKKSSSNRAVDQNASAAARRVTRSQSAEPGDVAPPPPRIAKQRGRPASAIRSAVNTVNNLKEQGVAPRLSIVQEDGRDNDSERDVEEDLEDAFPRSTNLRASVGSGFSGTTAKTSFSQEEIMELDADLIIDALPRLATAAEDLKRTIAPSEPNASPEVWKEIRRSDSKQNRFYRTRLSTVQLHKPNFGSEEYIQPRNVIRALLEVSAMKDVPLAVWRPDDILFNVNLVEMLNSLLITCDPSDWTNTGIDALERLHVAFPTAIAGPQFDMPSMQFYLSLAAQLTIARLEAHIRSEPQHSAVDVIESVLHDEASPIGFRSTAGLADVDDQTREEVFALVTQMEEELKRPFGEFDSETANAHLKSTFQWDHFTDHALQYFSHRKRVLDGQISAAGGLNEIVEGLTQEVERRKNLRASGKAVPKYTQRKSNSSASLMKALEAELMPPPPAMTEPRMQSNKQTDLDAIVDPGIRREQPSNTAPPVLIPQANMTLEDDGFVPLGDQDDANDEDQRMFESEDQLEDETEDQPLKSEKVIPEIAALQASQRAKREGRLKSFQDRQEGAVRVSFDDTQPTQSQIASAPRTNVPRGKKRAFVDEEDVDDGLEDNAEEQEDDEERDDGTEDFDPTQDDGFQTDNRKTAAADRKRKEVSYNAITKTKSSSTHSSHKSAPSSSEAAAEPVIFHTIADPPARRQRKNPGSRIPAATPTSSEYQAAKLNAKRNRALFPKPRATQSRVPWSEAEEQALLDLIENECEDGVSYAALKVIDNEGDKLLLDRDPEAMRFKARNMKVTFLRGRVPLPPNWDKVVLDKKAIDKLYEERIPYHQEQVRRKRG